MANPPDGMDLGVDDVIVSAVATPGPRESRVARVQGQFSPAMTLYMTCLRITSRCVRDVRLRMGRLKPPLPLDPAFRREYNPENLYLRL